MYDRMADEAIPAPRYGLNLDYPKTYPKKRVAKVTTCDIGPFGATT